MSFSFRNLFQIGSQPKTALGHEMPRPFGQIGHQAGVGQPSANPLSMAMQATSAISQPAQSPFQAAGSPLFKTASHEAMEAPPINAPTGMSPFSLPSVTPTNMPLTVGDVIGQLPPELVRGGALAHEQSITLPPALIENALRSGQAAVPVFEIYRVCPALFQTPVSPQDPRLVQLPAAKLPSLIASARTQASNAVPASPFAMASPQGGDRTMANSNAPSAFPMSPFAAAIPAAGGSENVPLSGISHQASASPFATAGTPVQQSPAPSPFGLAQPQAGGSPFATATNGQHGQLPSPFAAATSQGGASPVAPVASGAPPSGSPFSSPKESPFSPAAQDASPKAFTEASSSPSVVSPFAAVPPASDSQVPEGGSLGFAQQQSPQPSFGVATPPPAMVPPIEAAAKPAAFPQVSASPAAKGDKIKLGLAAILAGYSREELGFDPVMAPAWLQTSIERAHLQEQAHTGVVMIELGTLIDGVSDMGFRNMLTGAKRDYAVKLPQNEVFHALTESSGAPSTPANIAAAAVSPPTHGTFAAPSAPPQQTSAFAPPMMSVSPPSAPQPAANPPIAFAPFPMAPTESRAMFEEKPPQAELASIAPSAMANESSVSQTPPASGSVMEGMAGLFASKAPDVASPARSTTINLQPKPGVFSAFSTGEKLQAAPVPPPPVAPTFDPFGSPQKIPVAASESGLSSAQLLGQSPPASTVGAPSTTPVSRSLVDPFTSARTAPELPASPLIPDNPAPTAFFAPAKPEGCVQPAPSNPVPSTSAPAKVAGFPPAPEIQRVPTQPGSPFAPPSSSVSSENSSPETSRNSSNGQHSFLGLSPLDTDSDQLLLRALLGSDEKLDGNRVVRLLATQPGLCACVCLHGSSVLSHAKADVAEAAVFQQQAAEIARQVRGLAPLIGIAGAETFTLNAGKRLITFCFPGDLILGVLHENEPTTGLRDKITLVARELARMLA